MESGSNLEFLLNQHDRNISSMAYNQYSEMKDGVHDSQRLRADKTASFADFIKMIDKVVSLTLKDSNVKFIPDEGKIEYVSNDKKLDNPFINYKLLERTPKKEKKPRWRESYQETSDENLRTINVFGQTFACKVQFNIFASNHLTAEKILEDFEDAMFMYIGFFKKNGIAEILFERQFTDEYYISTRQTLSIRSICYYVEIEKLTVIIEENIKEIDTY